MSNLPNNTITPESLESHVDLYFIKRKSPKRFKDFLGIVGIRNMSKSGKARELGIAINTFKKWQAALAKEQREVIAAATETDA